MSYPKLFIKAIPYILEHEGGYNNKVNDKGGATNWGISLRFLKGIGQDINGDGEINYLDIKYLSKEKAEELYYHNFYKDYYNRLPEKLAIKLFDTNVNAGHKRSVILLQRALNILGASLKDDGLIGTFTLTQITKYSEEAILKAYCKKQLSFYSNIIKNDPTQIEFKNGWANRAKWLPK